MAKSIRLILCLILLGSLTASAGADSDTATGQCMICHKEKTPGLYQQWFNSPHGQNQISCLDCHGAEKDDADGFMHHDNLVATIVTPKDCGQCHEDELEETERSHHAKAGLILESSDAYLANAAAGWPVAIQGCESCHGTKIVIDPKSQNRLSVRSWPNTGIGRINPDGSRGACSACHSRHGFTKSQARQPEACSKCHLGPDHPQKEVYEESKHGNIYYTNREKMNLNAESWILGEDYFLAPTCATCHMSATSKQAITHDVGNRIVWNLRAPISEKFSGWENRRKNMVDVCQACHSNAFIRGHFHLFDATVHLYNEKFAKPASQIMSLVRTKNLLDRQAEFSNKIEWIYWEIWHHEGRRARHGAAMMGPDYTWWHGFYDIAKHFYFDFLEEVRTLKNGEIDAYVSSLLKENPMHQWLYESPESLKAKIKSGELQKIYLPLFDKK